MEGTTIGQGTDKRRRDPEAEDATLGVSPTSGDEDEPPAKKPGPALDHVEVKRVVRQVETENRGMVSAANLFEVDTVRLEAALDLRLGVELRKTGLLERFGV